MHAHSGYREDKSDWQLLDDHLKQTARLAAERAAGFGLSVTAHLTGMLHDLGKADSEFGRILNGEKVRFDHSTAGAKLALERFPAELQVVAEVLAHAILGHHAGLPDMRNDTGGSVSARIDSYTRPLPQALIDPETMKSTAMELRSKMRKDRAGFDMSVAARMVFSCLVDADYRDTESYYDQLEGREKERTWTELQVLLPRMRKAFDRRIAAFSHQSDLNMLRADILSHVRAGAALAPGVFTLTVPTGGGKTLASLGFALDHAAAHGHRRIIYAIPYTSIIDQTADEFTKILGTDAVLEHHSNIDTEFPGAEQREKLRLAMEDWAAPLIVTTNVQLFESLFAARPSRSRKLHNIAGSVIVLDEAQCLPRKLLLPVLAMIDSLVTHFGCSVVLCTATQPAFDSAQLAKRGLVGRELAPDPEHLAGRLRRARIELIGTMEDSELISALGATPQGLVIVNSRAHALELWRAAQARGLNGLIHLTTRQYPADRRQWIAEIRRRLSAGEPCRVIATSLVEAGVDLDFPRAWRAEAGLDSIVQAAGRVNREGRRPLDGSVLTVFSPPDHTPPHEVQALAGAMRSTAGRHEDLLSLAAIRNWFEEVYWKIGPDRLGQPIVDSFLFAPTGTDFPFRSVAESFRMIDQVMEPVIIARHEPARQQLAKLGLPGVHSGPIARALQAYTVQIPARAREVLRRNGKGAFHSPNLRGDQFFVLTDDSLYHADSGLWWEEADYLGADQAIL